jgi:L-alanine-DL-glutamate epimerase-like enolase superfamily enzyme
MRIIDIDIWTVVVPVLPGRVNSPEFSIPSWPDMPKQIVRLRADDGTYGLGETGRGCPRQAVEMAAEALIDRDPLALPLQDLPLVPDPARSHGPRAGSKAGHPMPGREQETGSPP